jgi:pyruvate/2-oxoglutarate dehydrogenase complex dihydrolipoamide acyltransferase (E2) component
MQKEVVIPRLGSSDEGDEVKILRWLKQPGEIVQKGDSLIEVETDKVNVEIDSPEAGRLKDIRVEEGDLVKFNSVVAVIEWEE